MAHSWTNQFERLFNANELTSFPVSLLSRSFVLTDQSLRCSLFSYQSGEEDWEPANRMLGLGHCRRILANEKQECIATVSMKKKNI